jgi:hypothetical protein
MQVHAMAAKSAKFADLSIDASALYLLACPSTADDIRDDILARADLGQAITHDEIARLNPERSGLAKLRALGEKREQKQRLKLGAVAKVRAPRPLQRSSGKRPQGIDVAAVRLGARRPAGVDSPNLYLDRLRLVRSISECSKRVPKRTRRSPFYGVPEGLTRRIKLPPKLRARAVSWTSINRRQSSELA